MSPEKQQIAIMEACGWKQLRQTGIWFNAEKGINGVIKDGEIHRKRVKMKLPGANQFLVPDYLGDLNAIHEAIRSRPIHEQWSIFTSPAAVVEGDIPAAFGKAAQYSEAFLRTLNLREDAQ